MLILKEKEVDTLGDIISIIRNNGITTKQIRILIVPTENIDADVHILTDDKNNVKIEGQLYWIFPHLMNYKNYQVITVINNFPFKEEEQPITILISKPYENSEKGVAKMTEIINKEKEHN